MALSLQQQFIDLQTFKNNTTQKGQGAILAAIEVKGSVVLRMEYIYYLGRFGPPINGVFDPIYLELIRAEIAAGQLP